MIPKDASYHRSAVQYNEELADFAEGLSARLEHEEVARWARSVSKQHKFHAGRHKKALAKLAQNGDTQTVETYDKGESEVIEEVVHRSSKDGKFVTASDADANPDTTEEQHVDIPVGPGNAGA